MLIDYRQMYIIIKYFTLVLILIRTQYSSIRDYIDTAQEPNYNKATHKVIRKMFLVFNYNITIT